ncbi:N-carbamoyl-D-amino-acid hydrolase [Bordetella genomosp. 2]|uniref:N-carbamoyl-D-amino-acid hydrolase n=1 Tax=Bordetella genomosp. 2 TaxID=1983456 RepID=A0A261VGE8_9BORD|nr:N-carbamoyl-D-amino-acid hydrolase [Bordetella genomosp. 2]OZI72592.1 N-carbamoyl-D-amino-acid hydrolase [Bordetella genomosp. 2]
MSAAKKLRLAVAQLGPVQRADTRAQVVRRLVDLLHEAHGRGARWVTFPELALTTFFPRWSLEDPAEVRSFFETEMPGPATRPLFDAARAKGIGFYLGYAELDGETQYNTSILVGPDGRIIGKYRKIHIPGDASSREGAALQHLEKKYFAVGDLGFPVWDTPDAAIGMCICNDRRWPETFRVMGLQGVDVVMVGYNTPSGYVQWNEPIHLRMHHHLLSLQSAAYQNACWIAAAAKAGVEEGSPMIGGSCIVAPAGEIMVRAFSEDDEVINYMCDLSVSGHYRANIFNFAAHRRPEHYRPIVERTGAGAPLGAAPP